MDSLIANYGSDSDSNSSTSDDNEEHGKQSHDNTTLPQISKSNPAIKERLPNLLVGSDSLTTSVFINPFLEEEKAQSQLLEKHVKVSVPLSQQTGRQICWNYRKGRCRFGHKCKYVHDSDIPGVAAAASGETSATPVAPPVANVHVGAPEQHQDTDEGPKKKKKRPGLCQTLEPSKKVVKYYNQTKSKR